MYDIDMKKINKGIKESIFFMVIELAITLYFTYKIVGESNNKGLSITLMLIFCGMSFKSLIDVIKGVGTSIKLKEKVEELNAFGTLVKNIPYTLVKETNKDTAFYIHYVQVLYTLPNGETIKLKSKMYDKLKIYQTNKTIDLIINVDDPEVYYIDFNINRLAGNKEEDYYKET